jgi:hypothetical protein
MLGLGQPFGLQSTTLLEGFWPLNNWSSNYVRASLSTMMDVIDKKNPIQILYFGPKNMGPLTTYTPFRDFNVENFVFMKLHDPNGCLHITVTLYGHHNGSFSYIP